MLEMIITMNKAILPWQPPHGQLMPPPSKECGHSHYGPQHWHHAGGGPARKWYL